jgi:hypothetical protein
MILGMMCSYKTQNRSKIRRMGPELPIEGGECTLYNQNVPVDR